MERQAIGTVEFPDGKIVEILDENNLYLIGDGFQLKKSRHKMTRLDLEEDNEEKDENPIEEVEATKTKKSKKKGEKKA